MFIGMVCSVDEANNALKCCGELEFCDQELEFVVNEE